MAGQMASHLIEVRILGGQLTFKNQIMADFSVNIELDDIIWNLSDSDKQEIIDDLYDMGYVPSQLEKNEQEPTNVLDELWFEAVDKIRQGRLQLTSEQEEVIMSIAKSL
jgi:hypothetical protein